MMYTHSIVFENHRLSIVDQTLLPGRLQYIELKTIAQTTEAIRTLKVRGAPAIGIVAAYALAVFAAQHQTLDSDELVSRLIQNADELAGSRPTAVNLFWAIDRMKRIIQSRRSTLVNDLEAEAIKIHEEDRLSCEKMGNYAQSLLADGCNILTHCNTGSLATGGWGTALGAAYAAKEAGKNVHVYVDETRPLGQGARLTFWELIHNNIPCTLITDSMSGSLMKAGKVDIVLFGSDRITANGDVANKIGSYNLAVLCQFHKIPCYAVAPLSTFDLNSTTGDQIPIEQRDATEILNCYNYTNQEELKKSVYNPAFDVTPAELLSGIITEYGIIEQPLGAEIRKLTHKVQEK